MAPNHERPPVGDDATERLKTSGYARSELDHAGKALERATVERADPDEVPGQVETLRLTTPDGWTYRYDRFDLRDDADDEPEPWTYTTSTRPDGTEGHHPGHVPQVCRDFSRENRDLSGVRRADPDPDPSTEGEQEIRTDGGRDEDPADRIQRERVGVAGDPVPDHQYGEPPDHTVDERPPEPIPRGKPSVELSDSPAGWTALFSQPLPHGTYRASETAETVPDALEALAGRIREDHSR